MSIRIAIAGLALALVSSCAARATEQALVTQEIAEHTENTESSSQFSQDIRAQLSPRQYTTIAAEIGAKIKLIPYSEGLSFKKGDLLLSFDCTLQKTQFAKANAVLSGAQKIYSANQRLLELHSIGKLELENSRIEVDKASADVDSVKAVLDKCDIVAPYNGKVAEQHVREQQFVQPGQNMLDIIDNSVLELEFFVPSHWLSWIMQGTSFYVIMDETEKTYPAKVTRIGARIDPVSQSIRLTAAIDGIYPELIAGMSGKVIFTLPENHKPALEK